MARADLLTRLYLASRPPMDFNFDFMQCPFRIENLLSYTDIMDIHTIIHSVRYMGNAEKRVNNIDSIMRKRNFRKLHAGTNRTVYLFLDDASFVAKVPIDKNGETDNLAENENQYLIKPYCTKMFQTTQTGSVSFSERVQPITSLEEFLSVADDIFNLLVYKILGDYVIDDAGASRFMNYGLRNGFGPVLLDYPKVFKLDGNKLKCRSMISGHICNGDIDFDDTFDFIRCKVCGALYPARDLASYVKEGKIKLINSLEGGNEPMKVTFMKRGQVINESDFGETSVVVSEKTDSKQYNQVKASLVVVGEEEEVNNSLNEEKEVFLTPNPMMTSNKSSEETQAKLVVTEQKVERKVFKASVKEEYSEEIPETVYQTDPDPIPEEPKIKSLDKLDDSIITEDRPDSEVSVKLEKALENILPRIDDLRYNSLPDPLRRIQDEKEKLPPKVTIKERRVVDKTNKFKRKFY